MTKITNAIAPSYIMLDGIEIPAEYSLCSEDETAFIRLNMSDGRCYSILLRASIDGEMYTAVMETVEFGVSTEFHSGELEELLALAVRI